MKQLRTEIEINASAERVWRILTDFKKYPDWNPFIKQVNGEVKEEAGLIVVITPPDDKPMTFKPTVKRVDENKEFRWLGRLLLPGIFDGEHIFEIEPTGMGTVRFIQRENFSGILVPLLWSKLEKNTKHGFIAMNLALKKRVESGEERC